MRTSGNLTGIKLCGIEAALPEREIINAEYSLYREHLGERKLRKQLEITGIRSCRVSDNETTESLCTEAASRLLTRLGWESSDIRGIVLVTQTPSQVMPSTAFCIQNNLGIPEDCIAFDVNLGCSGFVTGLMIAGSILQGLPVGARFLLLTGDTVTKTLVEEDIANRMMFGDAGCAAALERRDGDDILFLQKSLGEHYDRIFMKDQADHFHMDGMAVFHFTIDQVVGYIRQFMEEFNLSDDDIDYYLLHQAQKYIVENVAEFAHISDEKILISYDTCGNTSCASIPLTMALHRDRLPAGTRVLCCGFGVGLSCGIAYLTL